MTEKEQNQLVDRRLAEYSECLRTLRCLMSVLKEQGEALAELGNNLSEHPHLVTASLSTKRFSIEGNRLARHGIAADKELLSVLERVHHLHETIRKKHELEEFLRGTKHGHMIQE